MVTALSKHQWQFNSLIIKLTTKKKKKKKKIQS